MEKFYCEKCKALSDTAVKIITEEYPVKDENIAIEAEVRYCTICGEELWDHVLDGDNLKRAYDAYKKKKGLLSSEEIKKIRNKYDLSQSSFAKLLGFGEKTITRYENGAIQDKVQDNLIRLMDEVSVFEKLWSINKNELSEKENKKLCEKLYQIKKAKSLIVLYPTTNIYNYKTNIL